MTELVQSAFDTAVAGMKAQRESVQPNHTAAAEARPSPLQGAASSAPLSATVQQPPAWNGSETVSPSQPALLNPPDYSARIVRFVVEYVHRDKWHDAGHVLTAMLIDVSKETAALASEMWTEGISEARAEARRCTS